MLIAGPNLTVDRTLALETLRPGEVLRAERVVVTPGGKGLNVARAAGALGAPAVLVAFAPGHTGEAVRALVAAEGIVLHAVRVGGEVRSTEIVLERDGRTTVVNEPGPALAPGDWPRLEAGVEALLGEHAVLVCSGSVPPASPPDAYARLVGLARSRGRRVLVDASGATLHAALAAAPDLVLPNLTEAESVLGTGRGDEGEAVDAAPDAAPRALAAAQGLLAAGARAAVVTAAAAGAAVAGEGLAPTFLPAPRVQVVNPIGAGDAFTAGVAAALEAGTDMLGAARAGVAAGAASVEVATAGRLEPERARGLREQG